MKAKLGILCMIIGSVLCISALSLFIFNSREQRQAADSVDVIMPQLVDAINSRYEEVKDIPVSPYDSEQIIDSQTQVREMAVAEIDGYDYIGFVGIPSLELELPVMAEWSYPQLQIAPCRFTGNLYSDDLVIIAHNYSSHFGHIKELRVGDTVRFTDIDGVTTEFAVAAVDILQPTDAEEATAGDFDLTLLTCTYGGESRVAVFCNRMY